MKTKELLDKYQKIIGGLLKVQPQYIQFQVLKGSKWSEIASIQYEKENEDALIYNWCEGRYKVLVNGEVISTFELYQLPHCCAFLVSCRSFVEPTFRGKRIATTLNSMRKDIGRMLGYSSLLCTDIEQNKPQRQLLATNGWKDIHQVKNKRTNNQVFISVINL